VHLGKELGGGPITTVVASELTISISNRAVIFPLMEMEIGMKMGIFRQKWKVKLEFIRKN
jgi:hypothetical protein